MNIGIRSVGPAQSVALRLEFLHFCRCCHWMRTKERNAGFQPAFRPGSAGWKPALPENVETPGGRSQAPQKWSVRQPAWEVEPQDEDYSFEGGGKSVDGLFLQQELLRFHKTHW